MFLIQKISQRYSQREDRIEVAIQNEAGNVVRLWLTQRLANRMVAVLIKWLPEVQELESADANQNDKSQSTDDAEQKSGANKAQDASVSFDLAAEEGLLLTIDMSHQQKDYVLNFKWGVTGRASIKMGLEQLNAYIEGLIQLYRAANWDTKVFPESRVNTLTSKAPSFEDFPEEIENRTRTVH